MAYAIGIDQGGTKTVAAIASSDGHILGVGYGPGACHSVDGMEAAMDGVLQAVDAAKTEAGTFGFLSDPAARVPVVAGMSGADWKHEYGMLTDALAQTLGVPLNDVVVVNDSIVAMRGGTAEPYGAIVVAGTESNVAVRAPGGESFVFSYYIDEDDLGGSALGRLALRAVFDAAVGLGPPTALTFAVLAHFGATDVESLLMRYSLGELGSGVKHAAPLLFPAASTGDAAACRIVSAFGSHMGNYVGVGFRRLGMSELPGLEVVLSGSIFKAPSPLLRNSLEAAVRKWAPAARIVSARYEPVVGAVLMALEGSCGSLCHEALAFIEADAAQLELIRHQG